MPSRLAKALNYVLYDGEFQGTRLARDAAESAAIEFVPVPELRSGAKQGAGLANAIRVGGAGLEVDLSDPRQRSRLPPAFTAQLPARGWVNLPEAQALLQFVRKRLACTESVNVPSARPSAMAIVALCPAQARLIRMVAASELPDVAVEIDAPGAFREREFDEVFVSLTRSHARLPVSYGEGYPDLALALSRSRSRLVMFGDLGALARRSQWDGPVEQLDDAAARRERRLVERLVRYAESSISGAAEQNLVEVAVR
jgi:hypothetical protein